MNFVRKAFSVIGTTIAVMLIPITVMWIVFGVLIGATLPVITDPEVLKSGLAEQNIYADMIPVALPAVAERLPESSGELATAVADISSSLSDNVWRAVANEIVPSEWLRTETEAAIDALFAWLNGEEPQFTHQIDTAVLADSIRERDAASVIVALAEPCTPTEERELRALAAEPAVGSIPICSPSEANRAVVHDNLQSIFGQLAAALDAGSDLMLQQEIQALSDDIAENDPNFVPQQASIDIRIGFQTYPYLIRLFYIVPLMLFSLIVMSTVRSRRQFGWWIGTVMAASGILLLFSLIGLSRIVAGLASALVAANLTGDVGVLVNRLTSGLFNAAFVQLSGAVAAQAMAMVILGGGLFVVAVRSR